MLDYRRGEIDSREECVSIKTFVTAELLLQTFELQTFIIFLSLHEESQKQATQQPTLTGACLKKDYYFMFRAYE